MPVAVEPFEPHRSRGNPRRNRPGVCFQYRAGDAVTLPVDETPCWCGRTLPSLGSVKGRLDDVVYTPDGRRFTLSLRRGVRFSDGHAFDADDVVFSFQVYLDEKVASPQRDLLIVGGPPCQAFSKNAYWTDPGADAAFRRARARGEKAERPDIPPTRPDDARRTPCSWLSSIWLAAH